MSSTFPLFPAPAGRHLVALLGERIRLAPRARLLSSGGAHLTAEDLVEKGSAVAATFAAHGLVPGDRVAMQCGNRIELMEILVGCALLGLVLVPVNTASRGDQLCYYLRNSRAKIFITEEAQYANLQSAARVDRNAVENLQAIWSLDGAAQADGVPPIKAFPQDRAEFVPVRPQGADPAIVMYTSGTSGPSKGVMCSHAQLYWWGWHSLVNLGIGSTDVLYTCLPLFHINALNTFYQALIGGGRAVVGGKFSVSRFYEELRHSEATVTYLLGAMVPMLLSRAPDATERAHAVRVALAPGAAEKHYEEFESRTGIRILDGFGSTESNFVICTSLSDRKPGWMGKVAAGFQARVADEYDNEVPHGAPGELLLRNDEPFAFALGYFEMPEKTQEAWRNLWFHTGDRVLRDEAGNFKFLDRIKDSIRRRGENISSYEVELVIASHPSVESVAVYAVPSELAEDEVMCAIVRKPDCTLESLEIVEWSQPRLSHFAIPRFVRFLKELPKTENGKVQKYRLRAEGVTADTWDRVASGYVVKR
jgi:crotonobetaine/carnitine-CoA ligase